MKNTNWSMSVFDSERGKQNCFFFFTLPVAHFRIGWSNIGDDELLVLSSAIRIKNKLEELW